MDLLNQKIVFLMLLCNFGKTLFTNAYLKPRIVGGEKVTIKQFPYQLSLEYMGYAFCGGSIIGRNKALTAAHCTQDVNVSKLRVRAGSSFRGKGGQVIPVLMIHSHPKYNNETQDYDLSVLTLTRSIRFGLTASPVALAAYSRRSTGGQEAVVTGWGLLSENGEPAYQLQAVGVYELSNEQCQVLYKPTNKVITKRMSCYGLPGGKKTLGDSGGPLVVNGVQIGIVSWGIGCAQASYPGVYTRIAAVRDHIDFYAFRFLLM